MRVDKMGFVFWAEFAVGARTREEDILKQGQCQNCSRHTVPTWQAWCAVCWNEDHERVAEQKRRAGNAGSPAADLTAAAMDRNPILVTVAIPMETDGHRCNADGVHSW